MDMIWFSLISDFFIHADDGYVSQLTKALIVKSQPLLIIKKLLGYIGKRK